MRRWTLLLTLCVAAFAAACSGGGSVPVPPPPVGGFSNADLNGQYAFLMSGTDAGGFFGRVGVFVADGKGNITGGIEDVNTGLNGGVTETISFTNSAYSIQADGRGTLQLINQTGTLTFSITLISPSQGFISETDAIATTSGTFNLQNTSAFTQASISGSYVFDTSGIATDPNNFFVPDSIVGQIVSNGAGIITSGVFDENLGAEFAISPTPIASGTYQLDAVNGSTFGRGTLSFGGFNYVFYMVDSTRIRMIEDSTSALTLGDAVAQNNPPTNDAGFTGSFAFLTGGAGLGGSVTGPDTRIGRVTANGSGALSQVTLVDNDNFDAQSVPKGTLSAMTYTLDPNFPGSGRGELTFHDSSLGTYEFVFYMISPTQGVIQDNSVGFVGDGSILAQTGSPFTNSNLAGNYALNWSGQSFNSTNRVVAPEDFVGQVKLTNSASNNLTGSADSSVFSSNQGVFLDVVLTGNLTIRGDGTNTDPSNPNRNALQVKINTSPSATVNFSAYVVNANTMFIAVMDNNTRVVAGVLNRQSK